MFTPVFALDPSPQKARKRSTGMLVAFALVVSLFSLSGCSLIGQGKGGNEGDPTATPTTQVKQKRIPPPPGPVWPTDRPTQPREMVRDDEVGACATAQYWIEVLPWQIASGSTSILRQLADDTCSGCKNKIDDIEADVARGGWTRGQRVEKIELDHFTKVKDRYECIFVAKLSARSGWNPGDTAITTAPERVLGFKVTVKRVDGSWKVFYYGTRTFD